MTSNEDIRSRLPRLELYYELADETVGQERIINPTLVAWDRYAANRAGTADDPKKTGSTVMLYTWCLWYQLKAKGITQVTFQEFLERECLHVVDQLIEPETGETTDQELPDVDPTVPAPGPGSSSS